MKTRVQDIERQAGPDRKDLESTFSFPHDILPSLPVLFVLFVCLAGDIIPIGQSLPSPGHGSRGHARWSVPKFNFATQISTSPEQQQKRVDANAKMVCGDHRHRALSILTCMQADSSFPVQLDDIETEEQLQEVQEKIRKTWANKQAKRAGQVQIPTPL
jgi:hypothetical protein